MTGSVVLGSPLGWSKRLTTPARRIHVADAYPSLCSGVAGISASDHFRDSLVPPEFVARKIIGSRSPLDSNEAVSKNESEGTHKSNGLSKPMHRPYTTETQARSYHNVASSPRVFTASPNVKRPMHTISPPPPMPAYTPRSPIRANQGQAHRSPREHISSARTAPEQTSYSHTGDTPKSPDTIKVHSNSADSAAAAAAAAATTTTNANNTPRSPLERPSSPAMTVIIKTRMSSHSLQGSLAQDPGAEAWNFSPDSTSTRCSPVSPGAHDDDETLLELAHAVSTCSRAMRRVELLESHLQDATEKDEYLRKIVGQHEKTILDLRDKVKQRDKEILETRKRAGKQLKAVKEDGERKVNNIVDETKKALEDERAKASAQELRHNREVSDYTGQIHDLRVELRDLRAKVTELKGEVPKHAEYRKQQIELGTLAEKVEKQQSTIILLQNQVYRLWVQRGELMGVVDSMRHDRDKIERHARRCKERSLECYRHLQDFVADESRYNIIIGSFQARIKALEAHLEGGRRNETKLTVDAANRVQAEHLNDESRALEEKIAKRQEIMALCWQQLCELEEMSPPSNFSESSSSSLLAWQVLGTSSESSGGNVDAQQKSAAPKERQHRPMAPLSASGSRPRAATHRDSEQSPRPGTTPTSSARSAPFSFLSASFDVDKAKEYQAQEEWLRAFILDRESVSKQESSHSVVISLSSFNRISADRPTAGPPHFPASPPKRLSAARSPHVDY